MDFQGLSKGSLGVNGSKSDMKERGEELYEKVKDYFLSLDVPLEEKKEFKNKIISMFERQKAQTTMGMFTSGNKSERERIQKSLKKRRKS